MYQELPPLPWLRAFDASARLGNFTLAAEELGLTPSAVSYQVRGLEAALGHKLFIRKQKSLFLTRLGQAYLPVVSKAFGDIEATTSNLFGKSAAQEVTIRCLSSLNMLWLAPRLSNYHHLYPNGRLRLLSSLWSEAPDAAQIDIDIRYGDGNWSDGEATPLMHHDVIAVCAPALHPGPDPRQIATRPLIEVLGVTDTWHHFFALHGLEPAASDPALKVDQSLIALELASRGMGVALIARVFAQSYLDRGKLVEATDLTLPARQGHYLVQPNARNRFRPEVSAVKDWLLQEAATTAC